jgi:hypothetical protein
MIWRFFILAVSLIITMIGLVIMLFYSTVYNGIVISSSCSPTPPNSTSVTLSGSQSLSNSHNSGFIKPGQTQYCLLNAKPDKGSYNVILNTKSKKYYQSGDTVSYQKTSSMLKFVPANYVLIYTGRILLGLGLFMSLFSIYLFKINGR